MKKLIHKTKRLVLRPPELSDYQSWKSALIKSSTQKNKWDSKPTPPEKMSRALFAKQVRARAKLAKADRTYDFAIFTKSGEMVGSVAAMDVLRGISHTAFLGYKIFNGHWGKGYGKEAVSAFLHFAFKNLKLHRIEAGVEPTNRRSIFLARSLGLRKEGLKKRMIFLRNEWIDLIIYSATCEEFGYKFKWPKK